MDQTFFESERRSLLQTWDHVAVNVQDGAHFGMPQSFLDDFRVNTLLQHERCVGVAGILEPETGDCRTTPETRAEGVGG